MDEQERLKLKQIYSEMSDDEIIKIVLEDEEEYRKNPYEAYEMVLSEVRKRKIENRIKQIKEEDKIREEKRFENMNFEVVFRGTPTEAGLAKNLLESNGIPAFLRDETLALIAPHYASPSYNAIVKVVVERKNIKDAKEVLNNFLNGQN